MESSVLHHASCPCTRSRSRSSSLSSSSSSSTSTLKSRRRAAVWHHVLPGRLRVERGTMGDYRALEHFHYAPGKPAVPAGVWRVVYRARGPRPVHNPQSKIPNPQWSRLVAVAVLTFPTPASRARERALNLTGPRYGPKLALVNAHVRTIARVIVHPQFRGLGLAARLVHRICEHCPTRYVEAFAAMGDVHPFFAQAGMRRIEPADADEAAYFLFDREDA
jgi:GNAT superfamily N-acetyltransferase